MKERLKLAEKQEENMKYIVDIMKSNEDARNKELKKTKELLEYSKNQIKQLENITIQQISKVKNAEKNVENLKVKLYEKDAVIKDLNNRLKFNKQAERIKYLEGEIEFCHKERDSEQESMKILEKSMENLRSDSLESERVSEQESGETIENLRTDSLVTSLL